MKKADKVIASTGSEEEIDCTKKSLRKLESEKCVYFLLSFHKKLQGGNFQKWINVSMFVEEELLVYR